MTSNCCDVCTDCQRPDSDVNKVERRVRITYPMVIRAFLDKVKEYDLLDIPGHERDDLVIRYMKRAVSKFRYVCEYDIESYDDYNFEFAIDFDAKDIYELIRIISTGMVLEWLTPYLYSQDNLEMGINTRDYTAYSVQHEILRRVGAAYERLDKIYTNEIREYSYNHGDLTELHQ